MVPNLNKIMEEYAELENETVQPTKAVAGQGEKMAEVNEELEQTVEESRKRERGNEEAYSSEKKKLVIGSRIWPMSLRRTNCSIETSLGKEVSTSGFLNSKRLSKARDDNSSVSTNLRHL